MEDEKEKIKANIMYEIIAVHSQHANLSYDSYMEHWPQCKKTDS